MNEFIFHVMELQRVLSRVIVKADTVEEAEQKALDGYWENSELLIVDGVEDSWIVDRVKS